MARKYFLKTLIVLFALSWVFVWLSFAELVYDPVTNTYIETDDSNDTDTQTTSQNSDQTSQTSQSDADQDTQEDESQISSIQNFNEDDYPSVSSQDDDSADSDTDNDSDSDADDDETTVSTQSSQNQTEWTGTLQYMHEQIDDYEDDLRDLLDENHTALRDEIETLVGGSGENTRLEALQCLWIVDKEFDFINDIDETHDKLENQIWIAITDLHSAVNWLERKIDNNLLNTLDRNLQVWSLQNQIDSYYEEYINLIEMYYELSLDEVTDADELIDESVDEYGVVLELYDERTALYDEIQSWYSDFLKESSLLGTSSWANIQSLLTLLEHLEVYFKSQYVHERESKVGAYIPADNSGFLSTVRNQSLGAFSAYFSTQADELMYGLYPIRALQRIDNQILSLRSAYKKNNGAFDCQAVVENSLIDRIGPWILTMMDEVLEEMYESAQQYIGEDWDLPNSAEELEDIFKTALEEQSFDNIEALIAQEKARVENKAQREWVQWLPTPRITQKIRWKREVRDFLQEQYEQWLEANRLDQFDRVVERAYDKLNAKLGDDIPERVAQMLIAIKEVMEEFM